MPVGAAVANRGALEPHANGERTCREVANATFIKLAIAVVVFAIANLSASWLARRRTTTLRVAVAIAAGAWIGVAARAEVALATAVARLARLIRYTIAVVVDAIAIANRLATTWVGIVWARVVAVEHAVAIVVVIAEVVVSWALPTEVWSNAGHLEVERLAAWVKALEAHAVRGGCYCEVDNPC